MKKQCGYGSLAHYYDRLAADIDYAGIAGYLLDTCVRYTGRRPGLMLDLACGTGSLAIAAAKAGIQVIGADGSAQMLCEAYAKSKKAKTDILFLQQDICHFELYGTVDLITCCLDSVNHILDPLELKNMFSLAGNYLDPGGLLIFDVNSKYKFEQIYADNVFYEDYDDLIYIWQNKYNKNNRTAVFDLTFFSREKDGRYRREEDRILERYYSDDELRDMFEGSSLDLVASHDGFSVNNVKIDSQRILYILKSRKTFSNNK
jgi:SAM-dependent methyltransferase